MLEVVETIVQNMLQRIVATCQANAPAIADAFKEYWERDFRVQVGGLTAWQPGSPLKDLQNRGVSVALEVEQHGMLCLIPESAALPARVEDEPGLAARRNALAGELAKQILPPELIGGQHLGDAVADLSEEVRAANPTVQTMLLELVLFPVHRLQQGSEPVPADGGILADMDAGAIGQEAAPGGMPGASPASWSNPGGEIAPSATVYLVYPVLNPPLPATPLWPADEGWDQFDTGLRLPVSVVGREKAKRLRSLPVTVTVRLAEKRIPLGQLLSITPGGLITFKKSCEDLLDLYVNNRKYAQGEAVKIGEKFGLKINQIGVEEKRERRVR
jgi:flagellar motor switch protein FliN/FliY